MRRMGWLVVMCIALGMPGKARGQNIELVSSTLYSDYYRGIYLFGDYAYAAGQKVHILSIENPQSPRLCKYFDISIIALDTLGHYAYAATPDSTIKIIDVADPLNPVIVGSYQTYVNQIIISGHYAYTMTPTTGLKIFDLSAPLNPSLMSSLPVWSTHYDISGDYIFIAAGDGFKEYNISDRSNPIFIGEFHFLPVFHANTGLCANGNYLYLLRNFEVDLPYWADTYFQIIDVSAPENPTLIGQYYIEAVLSDIYIKNGFAYVRYLGAGLLDVVDVNDPQNPHLISSYDADWDEFITMSKIMAFKDSYMYINTGGLDQFDKHPWFRILDISNPDSLIEVGSYDSGKAFGVYVAGDYAYVANSESSGLKIINISNPSSPVILGGCIIPGRAKDVVIIDTVAYVIDELYTHSYGLEIINVADVNNPVMIGSCYGLGEYIRSISVNGNYAYIGSDTYGNFHGLRIVNISNPSAPYLVASYPLSSASAIMGIFVKDSLAYLTDSVYGLRILNVTNPQNPVLVGGVQTPGSAQDVSLYGNYAVVADNQSGLQIIDISDPANPTIAASYGDVPSATVLHITGHYLYVGYASGIKVLDISDPLNPISVGNYDTPGTPSGIYCQGEYAYVADQTSFLILHTPCTGIDDQPNPVPNTFSLSSNYPNPFNAQTTIKYALPAPSNVLVEIFDIAGRKVETLLSGHQEAGQHSIVWNAGDKPSGIYFYRIKAGEFSQAEKCILLK